MNRAVTFLQYSRKATARFRSLEQITIENVPLIYQRKTLSAT